MILTIFTELISIHIQLCPIVHRNGVVDKVEGDGDIQTRVSEATTALNIRTNSSNCRVLLSPPVCILITSNSHIIQVLLASQV